MDDYKFTLKKLCLHLRTVVKHRHYVFVYCLRCGIPLQGLVHDLSKFSPAEFITNVRYVRPGISPIRVQKEELGFSAPWLHHKGHNPHHYGYWMDKFDIGCRVTRIPCKYMIEMLCDSLGANKAYNGKRASYRSQLEWWKKQRGVRNMHPDNTAFLDVLFEELAETEASNAPAENAAAALRGAQDCPGRTLKSDKEILNKKHLEAVYNKILTGSELPLQVRIRVPEDLFDGAE